MGYLLDGVERIKNSEERFIPTFSKQLEKSSNEMDKIIAINEKEFERWGGWEPKLWYRMFYVLANKIYSHKPSQREFLYLFSPRISFETLEIALNQRRDNSKGEY